MSSPEIPDKLYFKIGEVADIVGVEAYVLRFWESEFPVLSPKKTKSGHRVYRKKDVETVVQIKELLYGKGYTIAGARRRLRSRNSDPGEELPEDTLRKVSHGLQAILTILEGNSGTEV